MHFIKLPFLLFLFCCIGLSQAGLTHRRLRETVPASVPANTVIISEPASDLRKDQIPVTVIQEAPAAPAIPLDEPDQKLRTEAQNANEIAAETAVATEIKDEKPITELRAAEEPAAPAVVAEESADESEVVVADDAAAAVASDDDDSDDLSVRQGTPATPASTTQGNFVQQLIQNSPIGQFFNQLTGQQQQQQQQQPQDSQVSADEPAAAATPAPTIPVFLNPQAAITSAQQAVQNAAQFVGNTTTQAFQGLQQLAAQFQNTLSNFGGNQVTSDSTTPRPPGPIQSVINNFIGGNNNNQSAAPVAGQGTNPLQGIISFFQGGNRPAQAAATPAISEAPAAADAEKPSRLDDKIEESQEISEQQQAELDATNEVRNSQEVGGGNDDSFEEIKPEEVIVVNDDASEQRV